jgi:hypothetical protein
MLPHIPSPTFAGAASVAALATAISDSASEFAAGKPPVAISDGTSKEAAAHVAVQVGGLECTVGLSCKQVWWVNVGE